MSTYYIDSAIGINTNNGTSQANGSGNVGPWLNISKVNSSTFSPGDSILFKRGQTHVGGIVFPSSGSSGNPITLGSYSTDPAKPIITGLVDVTSWASAGGNLYTATLAGPSRLDILTINGTQRYMGRYPNTGWYTISSFSYGSPTSSIIGNMPSSPTFIGGEVVIKKAEWIVDRHTITAHSGSTVTYTETEPAYMIENGFGYFIQNHLNTIDSAGDWHYNPSSDVLTLYSASSPTGIKAANIDALINTNAKNYITIDGLSFVGANQYCIYNNNSSNHIYQNCAFSLAGIDHIYGQGTTNITIQFNTFDRANNQAIYQVLGSTTSISTNVITNIGLIDGAGANNNEARNAVRVGGTNCTASSNTIDNVAYCGINVSGANFLVEKNYIQHFCLNVTDGGGIYVSNEAGSGKVIQDNICLYGYGNDVGTPYTGGSSNACFGIYLDEATANVTVRRNTCAFNGEGSGGGAIYYHKAHDCPTTFNTFYGNHKSQMKISQDLPNPYINGGLIQRVRNNTFSNNIVFSTSAGDWLYWFFTTPSPDEDSALFFSTMNNNILARPSGGTDMFHKYIWSVGTTVDYTLAQWKAAYTSYDQASTIAPVAFGTPRFEYNQLSSNKTVSLDGTYRDVFGADYVGAITLQPYTSAVLTKISDITGVLPVIGIKVALV